MAGDTTEPTEIASVFSVSSRMSGDPLSDYVGSLSVAINAFGHQHGNPTAEARRRVIGDLELIFYRGGRGNVIVGKRRYECRRGDLIIVPPFAVHDITTVPDDPHDNFWLHFDISPIYERDRVVSLLTPGSAETQLSLADNSRASMRLLDLADELTNRRPGFLAAASGMLRAVLVTLARENGRDAIAIPRPAAPHDQEVLDTVLSWATAHLAEEFGIANLLDVASTSRARLFELFRTHFGQPPMATIRWIRLREAELLLKTTTQTLSAIAAQVGIASPFHLSRLFKAAYGVSPDVYRRPEH